MRDGSEYTRTYYILCPAYLYLSGINFLFNLRIVFIKIDQRLYLYRRGLYIVNILEL